tara:strand:+ start:299 stop:715 length:417 start_codon:yes stop_codon:yes gene_type:complete
MKRYASRGLLKLTILLAVTFGLYWFYLIPSQAREVNLVIGREKYNFTLLLILGILTVGIALLVTNIMCAYDLERAGKAKGEETRVDNLGAIVLLLEIASLIIGFLSGGLAFIVSFGLGVYATWFVQKNLNHEAGASPV